MKKQNVRGGAWSGIALVMVTLAGMAGLSGLRAQFADAESYVDTALVVSVDVSNSVDAHRYKLQMEGIATALEDPEVLKTILNGPNASIFFSMVTWADRPRQVIGWERISSPAEAAVVANKVRRLPRQTGEFTCVSSMLRSISDKVVSQIPAKPFRTIVDVSGDGRENCNPDEEPAAVRDELAASGVTVNGLPILEGDEGDTLEQWYRDNVMAGPGSFVLPANGFGDFGRAIRQKFIMEISGGAPAYKEAAGRK